jgi:hypothetical protein
MYQLHNVERKLKGIFRTKSGTEKSIIAVICEKEIKWKGIMPVTYSEDSYTLWQALVV